MLPFNLLPPNRPCLGESLLGAEAIQNHGTLSELPSRWLRHAGHHPGVYDGVGEGWGNVCRENTNAERRGDNVR